LTTKVVALAPQARRAAALRVLRAREALGWSQERAAHELGIGVRTLRDIEAGKARMTALEALCAFERLLSQRAAGGAAGSVVPAAATGHLRKAA
jgi:ribosome-binding protein aMBF1 (putative translation factor)